MNDTIYTMTIQELTDTNANLSLERAVFKARFSEVDERAQKAEAGLARVEAVFASDPELKELFDEAEKKMEENNGAEQK